MIDTKIAEAQIFRLSGMNYFPKHKTDADKFAITELIRTLQRWAKNEAHAAEIIQRWLDQSPKAPTPHDLSNLAQATAAQHLARPGLCSVCDGTGWAPKHIMRTVGAFGRVTQQDITAEQYLDLAPKVAGPGLQQVSPAVDRCTECKFGRRLADAEAQERDAPYTPSSRTSKLGVVGGR